MKGRRSSIASVLLGAVILLAVAACNTAPRPAADKPVGGPAQLPDSTSRSEASSSVESASSPAPLKPETPPLDALRVEASLTISEPQLVERGGTAVLVIPAALEEAIARDFAGFRIPSQDDLTVPWKKVMKQGQVPFIAWGDYTGDGRTDIALVVVGGVGCRLVMFHGAPEGRLETVLLSGSNDCTWLPNRDLTPPTVWVLGTYPKGRDYIEYAYNEKTGGTDEHPHRWDLDTLSVYVEEGGMWLYYWAEGKYQTIESPYE